MRLIDADVLIKELNKRQAEPAYQHHGEDWYVGMISAEELVYEQPTINDKRHAKWIEIHGYCTPGGDPVWRCSNCGKGEHVYGIEHNSYGARVADYQWVACPNCGCEMDN